MIIFISPAKGFKSVEYKCSTKPMMIENSKEIISTLKKLSLEEICKIMKINEDIGKLNLDRFKKFKLDNNGNPALMSYDGIQYKNINASNMNKNDLQFANNHIRIISGLYGVVKPLDSIYPYRLEMQTKLNISNSKNLYEYWNNKIYKNILGDIKSDKEKVIVNLASEEYSKIIKKYIDDDVKYITCTFKINKNNKLSTHSTYSKSARGKMVNYIVKNKITNFEHLKKFNSDGYSLNKEIISSDGNLIEYIFVKTI